MSSLPEGTDVAGNNTSDLPPYSSQPNEADMKQMDMEPQEEVVVLQQSQPRAQQGTITVVVSPSQQQQQQPMMMTPQQPLQQQGYAMAVPADASNTVPVSENPYIRSNNVVTDKRKEFMIGVDIGFYRVKPELDKLDEMKPWESDGQMYSFACCTELFEGTLAVDAQNDKKVQSVGTATAEASWAHTVYHKTNTDMLTVLKKEMVSTQSTFDFSTKNNNKCLYTMESLMVLVGLILVIAGAAINGEDSSSDSNSNWDSDTTSSSDGGGGGALIGIGVALWVLAIVIMVVVLCQQKKASGSALNTSQNLEITATSIPIYSVSSVKRKATLTHSKSSSSVRASDCNCCAAVVPAPQNNEQKDDICELSIYYRSSGGVVVGEPLEVKLSAHQGFNLQRYLNCVIDGCHPKWREDYGDRNKYSLELKKEQ